VTYAEILGLFGREGLDLATAWSPPAADEAGFAAYKLFSRFESTSVRASVTGDDRVKAFAAIGTDRMTVALINQGPATDVTVSLAGFEAEELAELYERGQGSAIDPRPDVTVTNGEAIVSLGAQSIAMLIFAARAPIATDAGTGGMDAAPVADTGTMKDAGVNDGAIGDDASPSDAAATADAGDEPSNPGGCGCSSTGRTDATVLPLLGLAAIAYRRRRG
jgi:MYXO-CTERM domain-containing protein